MASIQRRKLIRMTYVVIISMILITLLFLLPRKIATRDSLPAFTQSSASEHPDAEAKPLSNLSFPLAYVSRPAESEWCEERFGLQHLRNVRDSALSYCSDDTSSFSCFWSTTTHNRHDAMCFGSGASFNARGSKFEFSCPLRKMSPTELKGNPDIPNGLTQYWYDTGPGNVFRESILLNTTSSKALSLPQRLTRILVKREGAGNLWHCMMELLSLSWTLDVLQISVDTRTQRPYLAYDAASSTQVVFLDEHDDGPFIELWGLFAKMPIVRLHQLNASEVSSDIIIPFAGGGNTLWQGDWVDLDCRQSALVETFVSRVLHLYGISTRPPGNAQINAKFIRRTGTRVLVNETSLMESVRQSIPHLQLEVIDFAIIPFSQQLEVIRSTDLLIGVHGAGLTHLMFLPPGSAVVEILPGEFSHKGFRNLAQMLGHQYYRTHAKMHGDATGGSQWQFDAVEMESSQLVNLIQGAAYGLYNRGMRSFDIA